ncbi:divergent serine/threonine protein kinase [Brazilian marseillevirus]|uniref:divergent serine/threonine protein kinase n=1 Tax=Brazilian marseillevirus TaxID=1813599 RepID=UPI000783143D|nr:divergent serine/threonine protein kinase [Brazilian marseillevirus]AMQ10916.1 divergent serine/threonine protein kinase [Brazilian marseillevirus]
MERFITVHYDRNTYTFKGTNEFDAQADAETFLLEKAKSLAMPLQEFGEYIKLVILPKGEVSPEVEFYEYLDGTEITPKLLRTGSLFPFQMVYDSGLSFESHYFYMVFEEFGRALDEIYGVSCECMNSSEDLLDDADLFDKIFPQEDFPEDTRKSIRHLLEKISDMRLEHQDIHSGNILVGEEGKMKLIDFEYTEFL